MKKILQEGNRFVLRFDPGEELMQQLRDFCAGEGITAATFTAIGSAEAVTVAFYDPALRRYQDHDIHEPLEMVSLNGNVATLNNEVVLHAHGVFADRHLQAGAGHVKRVVVAATAEVFIDAYEGELKRSFSARTNLNILE